MRGSLTFSEALAQVLREDEASEKERRKDKPLAWYPSQLGSCVRRTVLEHSGVEGLPYDDRTLRLFWLGSAIHEALQGKFPFEVIGHEVEINATDPAVRGRIDTVARIGPYTEAVEFKSVNSKKFGYPLPDPTHLLQIGCYLIFPAFASDGQRIKIDRARLVYWSKDDARIEEYIVERTPELEQRVREHILQLEESYQRYGLSGELPQALPRSDWRTRYCKYLGTGKCCGDKVIENPSGRDSDIGDSVPVQQTTLGRDGDLGPEDGKVKLAKTKRGYARTPKAGA